MVNDLQVVLAHLAPFSLTSADHVCRLAEVKRVSGKEKRVRLRPGRAAAAAGWSMTCKMSFELNPFLSPQLIMCARWAGCRLAEVVLEKRVRPLGAAAG